MLQDYGLEKFHSRLQSLGFSSIGEAPGHYGLTLILGGAEVTLWDLCRVYMGMANSLNHFHEYEFSYDRHAYDPPVYALAPASGETDTDLISKGILSAASIWQCFESLTELERPTQEGNWERFSSTKTIAWKTGTSFGYRDAWAIGVTPGYLVGVWVGNADGEGRPGLTGVNVAAPLMFDVFGLLPSSGWFEIPDVEMTEIEICMRSGFRAGPDCDQTEIQMVPEAGALVEACPYHQRIHLDRTGQFRVNSSCYATAQMIPASWFVLPPVMEWYYKRKIPHYQSLPSFLPGCADGNEAPMELIYPKETRQVFVPRGLDGKLSRVVFEAAHRDGGADIYWHLDDRYLGETSLMHTMEFLPPEGQHTLILVDSRGNILEKQFEVVTE
jgi:penicillin-binding protein 1C